MITLNNGISGNTKLLLRCGQAACILFILLFLIQGQLREAYTPLKFPISSLSIGDLGWIQITNFLVSGALVILFSIGFRKATPLLKGSASTAWLFAAGGIGLFGAGLFSTDPVYGYPVTEPLRLAQFTITGHLHDFFSILVFACLPIACFKMKNRFKESHYKNWEVYTFISVMGMLISFFLAGAGFKQTPGLVEYAGVFQRLSVSFGFIWLAALAGFIIKNSGSE